MKVFSIFILLVISGLLKANDTLTRAQVYNFNVGDTFDYRIVAASTAGYPPADINTINFERDIIANQWTDTITHALHIVKFVHSTIPNSVDGYDTVIISNQQTYAFYADTVCQARFFIDSNSVYNGRLLNGNIQVCFEDGRQTSYVNGLGQVLYIWGTDFTGSDILYSDSTYLIYYSKSAEHWGTPYYIANGETLIHFTPIPEKCAVWNDTVAGWDYPEILSVKEQIVTGNRIPFHGHTYVEMLYSADYKMYNEADSFIIGSLIGYFRNDTLGRQTLFYYSLSDTSFFSYNFNQLVDGAKCTAIDTIMVNGISHTRWTYNRNYFSASTNMQYLEGIGGLFGLIPVYHPATYFDNGYLHYAFGALTCFSICGQTIYPSDTFAACPLISGVTELTQNSNNIKLYPTLNNGQFQIDVDENQDYKFTIHDILDRQIHSSEIHAGKNLVTLTDPHAGIYFWTATIGEKVIEPGRFIVVN